MFEFFVNLSRLTRPLSNVKNLAIIALAFFLSGAEFDLADVLIGFFSLSLVCSAVYGFNTLCDLKCDKDNKNKEHYTKAVTYFGKGVIYIILAALVIAGLLLGYYVDAYFVGGLLLLLIVGFLYSSPYTRFKEKILLDVIFGAILTYPLRFFAAWFIFELSFPPLLPIMGLAFAKAGGYMMYKELDRPFFVLQKIKNSITALSKSANILLSSLFWLLAVAAFVLMCLGSRYFRSELWGYLPFRFLSLLPLIIPAIIVTYFKALDRLTMSNNHLRVAGFAYFVLAIGLALVI